MADAESKAALKAYQKAWREANAERRKDYAREYYKANKERMNRAAAERYRADPEAYKTRAAKWAKENPERRYEIADKWRAEHPAIYVEARRLDWVKNKLKRQINSKEFRAANPGLLRHYGSLRRALEMHATPAWANLDAIEAIYVEAARLRKETGRVFHVDHAIPLKHKLVCGLHNEFNLQILTAFENQSKHNTFEV